jgi:hypothetical protein
MRTFASMGSLPQRICWLPQRICLVPQRICWLSQRVGFFPRGRLPLRPNGSSGTGAQSRAGARSHKESIGSHKESVGSHRGSVFSPWEAFFPVGGCPCGRMDAVAPAHIREQGLAPTRNLFAPTKNLLAPTEGLLALTEGLFAPTKNQLAPTEGLFFPRGRLPLRPNGCSGSGAHSRAGARSHEESVCSYRESASFHEESARFH